MVQTPEPVPTRGRPGEPSPDAVTLLGALTRDVHTWATALKDTRYRLLDAAQGSPGGPGSGVDGSPGVPVPRTAALVIGPYAARTWPWPAGLGAALLSALGAGRHVRVLSGPDTAHPDAARPDTARPDTARPDTARPDTARPDTARRAPDLDAAGAQVRTLAAALPPLLLIDGTLAVVPRPGGDAAVLTVGDPTVVGLLHHFAEILWSDAVPAAHRDDPPVHDTVLANRHLRHRILQLLAEGAKDETVARTLDISVRTCRRHIADILTRLGAVSRFQAGVQAMRLGLLAPEGPTAAGPWPATRAALPRRPAPPHTGMPTRQPPTRRIDRLRSTK